MKKAFAILRGCLAVALLSGMSVDSFGQALKIPVRVELETSTREVMVGAKIQLRVSLRNLENRSVTALRDTAVTVASESFAEEKTIVIPRALSSAEGEFRTVRAGLASVNAKSNGLAPSSLLLVIRPARSFLSGLQKTAGPVRGDAGAAVVPRHASSAAERELSQPKMASRSTAVAAPPVPATVEAGRTRVKMGARSTLAVAPPGATSTESQPSQPNTTGIPVATVTAPTRIDLEINPTQIYPQGNSWIAEITVIALTNDNELAAASQDIPVRLQADLGDLSATQTVIPLGSASTAAQSIQLTSRRSGDDRIQATSAVGSTEKRVTYFMSLPSGLRLEANPPTVLNDGRSSVDVTVFLLGPDNRPTSYSDRDIHVLLSSSLGVLDTKSLPILRGSFWGNTKLTSAQHGLATIEAKAPELADALPASVQFLFPWMMIVMATVGGMAGGVIRAGGGAFSPKWWDHLWRNTAVAAALGFFFYVLAFFGAIAALPKTELPFAISSIPTVNELGALLLGFVGGLYGRHVWKV